MNPNGDRTVPRSAPTPHHYFRQDTSQTLTHSVNVALCDLLFFYCGPVSSSDLVSYDLMPKKCSEARNTSFDIKRTITVSTFP